MRSYLIFGVLSLFCSNSFADCISAQKKVMDFFTEWNPAATVCNGEMQKAFGANPSDSGTGPVAYRMAKAFSDQHGRIRSASGVCGKMVEGCNSAKARYAQELERYCDPEAAATNLKALEVIHNKVCGEVARKTCFLVKDLAPKAKSDFWKSYASTRESSSDRNFLMELDKIQPNEISDPACQ